jgi:hypothetical protein
MMKRMLLLALAAVGGLVTGCQSGHHLSHAGGSGAVVQSGRAHGTSAYMQRTDEKFTWMLGDSRHSNRATREFQPIPN